MTNKINILHLSDLHFGREGDATEKAMRENALNGLVRALNLNHLGSEWKPDIIVISGDIGWKGGSEDYELAKNWIEDHLLYTLNLTSDELILCAGNHDIDRKKTKGMNPPTSEKEADDWLKIENLDSFIRPFESFNSFCKDMKIPDMEIGDKSFHLIGQKDLKGLRFVVAKKQLADHYDYDNEIITISVFHHPPSWLNEAERNSYADRLNTVRYLSERCHITLCGHVHAALEEPDRKYNHAYLLKGGATYEGGGYRNNFTIIQVDKEKRGFRRRSFEFDLK